MNKHKGFSLLEILVAFSILAISLGILLKIFSSGVNTAIIAEEYTVATQIAESLMAKTGIEEVLTVSEISGTEREKYHWRVNVENIPHPETDEESTVELLAVQVTVEWGDDGQKSRVVELNTVKTGQQQ
ncbi:MAG: prepilin-type N-terminal cleavage/methylation domain-containing protein [Methylococcales bacterium]|nr:prepilin-type N-terminal cleavage/methylation domain-containing protein [Methylococcales bacterium]